MTNIAATAENARLWKIAKIVPKRQHEVDSVVVRLVAPSAKFRYQSAVIVRKARPSNHLYVRPPAN